jgi:enolase
MKIQDIKAIQIIDSRGNPTVEVKIQSSQNYAIGSCPSGASTGSLEALELRDGFANIFHGKSVTKAVNHVNTIIRNAVVGESFDSIEQFDKLLQNLDNTDNKSRLGANAILGCSIAFTKILAKENKIEVFELFSKNPSLPVPMMNVLNGGVHADNPLNIQEFMIMPVFGSTFAESLRCGCEIYQTLKKILYDKKLSTNVGDEGGFAPYLSSHIDALDLICESIQKSGYEVGKDVLLTLDVAATELYSDNKYEINPNNFLNKQEMLNFYADLIKKYPIFSIEDAFAENDDEAFIQMSKLLNNTLQIVGDDVFVTNPKILQDKIQKNICNTVLIKPNQIGTISETIKFTELAKSNNYNTIMSHRSGETEETIISDLAVGLNTMQIKTGAPARGERVAKYNRLIRIESEYPNIKFSGSDIFEKFKKLR